MSCRIYKHECSDVDCKATFYLDDLKLVGVPPCPLCFNKSKYIEEKVIKENESFGENKETLDFVKKIIENFEVEWNKEQPLLTIELQDETHVPKVSYKGKEVVGKVSVSFDWDTDTSIPGGLTYAIEHAVAGEGYPVTNRIERRVKGHAVD